MKHLCSCKINPSWPFLVSLCKHGHLIERKEKPAPPVPPKQLEEAML